MMKGCQIIHSKLHDKIQVPALIIQGNNDPVFSVDYAHNMKAKIANSELAILDDFRYALMPRHFDKVASLIDDFIKKVS